MRKVVVDTHVLLASLLGGEPRLVMKYWWEGKVSLCLSEEIAAEYLAALARLGEAKEAARELMEAFAKPGRRGHRVEWVKPEQDDSEGPFSKRPALNKFVACARAGGADAIIALDPDLVERGDIGKLQVITPGEFLEAMAGGKW